MSQEPAGRQPTAPDDDDEPGQPGIPVEWAVDTALGAASAAGRIASAFSRSTPGRFLSDAARVVSAPLTREGHEFRDRAAPAAQDVLSTVTPEVVGAIDLNAILAAIDINALLDDVDIGAILDKVDVGEIVSRVDVDEIVARVDIDAIVERVDISALLERVDIEEILDRIDLNELVSRIDVDKLIQETELGSIIASSTTGVASEALDAVRRQGVSLDNVVARVANRVVRRDIDELPPGPPLLVEAEVVQGELPAGSAPSDATAPPGVEAKQ
ncbi:MAG: hypothetical protein ACR2OH_13945 [Microthrixaceae bacterium]